jgi:hypothetical protein
MAARQETIIARKRRKEKTKQKTIYLSKLSR